MNVFSRMLHTRIGLSKGLSVLALGIALLSGRVEQANAGSLDLIRSFEAIPYTGWVPCDPVIAAGPDSLVTMVVPKIVIYDKVGTKLFEQSLLGSSGFWGAQGASASVAEGWVIFDPHSSRFIAVAADFGTKKGVIYLAVSKTASPRVSSDWHKYAINRSGTHQAAGFGGVPTYPDYVKVGVNMDRIYLTSIHFAKDQNITQLFSHDEIFAIEKSSVLSGGQPVFVYNEPIITGSDAFPIQPAIVFNAGTTMYLVKAAPRGNSSEIVVNTIDGATRSTWLIPAAAFERPSDVPQRGSQNLLLNIDARLMSAVVRNGALWTTHAVKDPAVGPESVVRWYEVDLGGATPFLVQSGNVDGGDGIHTWLPHINVDAAGNMGVSFSMSGAGQYAAIAYTGRSANDVLGTTRPIRTARAGAGAYKLQGWGEYSGLAIDPDGSTFWLFHEYPNQAGNWQTFAASFQVEVPPLVGPLHCGNLDASATKSKKNWKASVVVTTHDGNHNPLAGVTVSGQWSTGLNQSGVSDATGKIAFSLGSINLNTSTLTFTVTDASHAELTYEAGANHDADGDSNGTSVTVSRP